MSYTKVPTISPVYCPIKPAIADKVEILQLYADQWASLYRFFPNETALKRFHRAKFAWLGARSYADAHPEMLKLITGWLCFTFFLDDQCEKEVGTNPEQLRKIFSRFVSYLEGTLPPSEANGPLFDALKDLWSRTLRCVPSDSWCPRFIKNLGDYLESNAWEAENKEQNRIPSLQEYIEHRQYTVAAYLFFDLAEVTQSLKMPDPTPPEISRLQRMANNIIAWFNDIISLEKELPTNDVHNLVIILRNEFKCSLQTAMDKAVEMHNIEMKQFLQLEAQVLSDPRYRDDDTIAEYIRGLRFWIRGNVDWSYESGRYLPDGATPEELIISYFD
jgi:5-epi-alpha-selinene synthase